jgi:hypothetical protein
MSKETDKEFLLRMAGAVNSECWGTPEQEADQARMKGIADRLSCRENEEDVKYLRELGEGINEVPRSKNAFGACCRMGHDYIIDPDRLNAIADKLEGEYQNEQDRKAQEARNAK